MKKVAILGIADVCQYAAVVGLYLVFKTEPLLTLWEIVTMLSAPVMLLILLEILKKCGTGSTLCHSLTLVFMACVIALTSAAHIVNITVTRRLMAEGVDVPTYFQIGNWPSVEMAVDYLAWGFFMGLAFIATALSLRHAERGSKRLMSLLLLCGALCLAGFFGAVLFNENLWYLAPMGYGVGTLFVCVTIIRSKGTC